MDATKNFDTIMIVDEDKKKEFLLRSVDDTVFVLSIESIIKSVDVCLSDAFSGIKFMQKYISNASVTYVVPCDLNSDNSLLLAVLEYIGVEEYYSLEYDINDTKVVNDALKHARLVSRNEVRALYAEYAVIKFFKCRITKVLQWYFDKEELATNSEIAELNVTLPALTALSKIVITEESIENFVPEEFQKVGIVYQYADIQFTVRNSKKFGKKLESELELFIRQLNNPKNLHIVKDFKREAKNLKPPPPLTINTLERVGVTRFGFSIDYLVKVATELRKGEFTIAGKYIGPLITPIYTTTQKINSDATLEINNLIINTYGSKYISPGNREYAKTDEDKNSHKEAIRPLYFSEEFFPKNIRPYLSEDQFKIYSVIFYRSIAAFMADAVINVSELIVAVEGIEFKAVSKIVSKDEIGNVYDGWLKIGTFLGSDEADQINENTVLPESLYPGQEFTGESREILEFKTFTSNERNPARWGEGRLKASLIKDGLVAELSDSSSINQLKEQKLAFPAHGTLHPSGLGKKVYYTLEEYADWIFNEDFAKAYVDSLDMIAEGNYTKESMMESFYLNEGIFKKNIGYKESINRNAPEEWLVNKAKRVANQIGATLPDTTLGSRNLLFAYIEQNNPELEKLGKCVDCRNGEIYEQDKGFFCNNSNCNFALWKDGIDRFFKYFKKHIPMHDYKEVVRVILSNKKCQIDGLYNNKEDKNFSAYITISLDDKYRKWKIDFYTEKRATAEEEPALGDDSSQSEDGYEARESDYIEEDRDREDNRYEDHDESSYEHFENVYENEVNDAFYAAQEYEQTDSVSLSEINNAFDVAQEQAESVQPVCEKEIMARENEELLRKIKRGEEEKRLLADKATKDELTRAYNKGCFIDDMNKHWASGSSDSLVLAFVDADKFKNVNDTYGHKCGDTVLVELSNLMHDSIRSLNAKLYRYGGEEFCIVSQESQEESLQLFAGIRKAMESKVIHFEEHSITVTISIGVAFGINKKLPSDLIKKADSFVYMAKEQGRNRMLSETMLEIKNQILKERIESIDKEKAALYSKATIDDMTKAYNRAQFNIDMEVIEEEGLLPRATLAFIDADKFKNVNDTYGHECGDMVLITLVSTIHGCIEGLELKLYRYGGEEFCIVSLESQEKSLKVFEEIRRAMESKVIHYEEHSITVTISIGVAFGEDEVTSSGLTEKADLMVFAAKDQGRNRIVTTRVVEMTCDIEDKPKQNDESLESFWKEHSNIGRTFAILPLIEDYEIIKFIDEAEVSYRHYADCTFLVMKIDMRQGTALIENINNLFPQAPLAFGVVVSLEVFTYDEQIIQYTLKLYEDAKEKNKFIYKRM